VRGFRIRLVIDKTAARRQWFGDGATCPVMNPFLMYVSFFGRDLVLFYLGRGKDYMLHYRA